VKAAHWNHWGADIANTRFQNASAAGISAEDVPKLKLKWAFGLGEGTAVYSQVAAGDGRVFVADLTGNVYSLDASTGCIRWTFKADAPIHSAVVRTDASVKQPAIYFGDQRANAYAVDSGTGKLLWRVHVEDHFAAIISGAPQFHDGVLYVPVSSYEEALASSPKYECCTFRGSVVALDAATGKRIWKAYTIPQSPQPTTMSKTGAQMRGPAGAAVWSTPTIDEKRHALYVSTGDNYSKPSTPTSDAVLAFDLGSGKLLWSKQLTPNDVYNLGSNSNGHDFDFGQPPILVSLPNGHSALVIGQKSGVAHALDPDRKGEILWQTRVGEGGALGGIQWGSAADNQLMYVALSDLVMKGVADKTAPRGYRLELDPNHGGGLFALRLGSGEKVWTAKPASCGERKHCSPAQSAPVTVIPGAVFSGSVDGHMRAYSTATGQVIWDVDTVREYDTVNGQKARGGSLDHTGPVIAGGMLYITSGYGQWGGMPGNVLLAFSVNGR
jgi:polyvinyl alcohol dehydrogenase (cytochrome)